MSDAEGRAGGRRRIGFVGLGAMGGGMVRSLRRGGFPVAVYDLDPERIAALADTGVEEVGNPRSAARFGRVVMTSLPTPEAVEAAVLGPGGVLEGLEPGAVYIDLSTIDPATVRKVGAAVAAKGARMIDSPVGKGPAEAAAGELTLMLGGDAATIAEVADVLAAISSARFHCGPLGAGAAAKLVNNLVSCTMCALNGEAMVLAKKAGVDLQTMVDIMKTTAADNRHLRITTEPMTLAGNFAPRFRLAWANKDLRLAVQLGLQLGVPTPVAHAAQTTHLVAMGLGFAEEDQSACIKTTERAAGTEARRA